MKYALKYVYNGACWSILECTESYWSILGRAGFIHEYAVVARTLQVSQGTFS